MLFDSDNIPLVTRVEAGPGVIVTYLKNNDDEGVWTASIDSDYLVSVIDKNEILSDSEIAILKLNEDRIKVMEEILGISTNTVLSAAPGGDSDTHYIKYTQSLVNLSSQLEIKWELISFDGDGIVDKRLTFGANSTQQNIMNSLMYSIKSDRSVNNYLDSIIFNDAKDKIVYQFKDAYADFKFKITVISTSTPVTFEIKP